MKKVFKNLLLPFFILSLFPLAALAYSFNQDLTLGSSGSDVIELQNILISEKLLVMPFGVNKGYFGTLTQEALKKYQTLKGISPALGYFGPLTRNIVNTTLPIVATAVDPTATSTASMKTNTFDQTLFFGKQITKKDADAPYITKVSTLSAKINERITVEGENFGNSVTVYSSVGVLEGKKVNDGTVIFNFSEILGNLSELQGLPITFSVGNSKGISSNYGYVVIK